MTPAGRISVPLLALLGAVWQVPDSTIAGRVVDGVSGRPVDSAVVTLAASGGVSLKTESGAGGAFTFTRAGGFSGALISATKTGYRTSYVGQLGPGDYYAASFRLDVAPGIQRGALLLTLWPVGTITGHVFDQRGAPIAGATVDVLENKYSGSGARWVRVSGTFKTDALGEYTVDRLAGGEYLIAARPPAVPGVAARATAPTYFASSHSASYAKVLTVGPGMRQTADVIVDLAGSRPVTLTGRLTGADRSLDRAVVHLTPANPGGGPLTELDEITTTAGADGRFRFEQIPAGDYRLTVCQFPPVSFPTFAVGGDFSRTVLTYAGGGLMPDGPIRLLPLPSAPTWIADMPITADPDNQTSVDVVVRPGAKIRGFVVFDGASPRPSPEDLETIPVVIRPADGGRAGSNAVQDAVPQPRIEANGRFASIGLPPGDYIVNVVAAARSTGADVLKRWTAASVTAGGRETIGGTISLDSNDLDGVTLTMTDKVTEVTGTVNIRGVSSDVNARVIIFPRDSAMRNQSFVSPAPRRVQLTLTDRAGGFRFTTLAGEYLVAAVTTLPASWMTSDYLQSLVAQATPVQIKLGERKTIAVTVR